MPDRCSISRIEDRVKGYTYRRWQGIRVNRSFARATDLIRHSVQDDVDDVYDDDAHVNDEPESGAVLREPVRYV